MQCSQCEKQAIYTLGTTPLCLNCDIKRKEASCNVMKTAIQAMNYADEMMAFQLGFGPYPGSKHVPTQKGDLTLNNINITGSKIGVLNTGNMHKLSINQSIETLSNAGKDDMANALKTLNDAIRDNNEISNAIKNELTESLSFIAEEAKKPPAHIQRSIVKTTIENLDKLASTVGTLHQAWCKVAPIIRLFFN